MILRRGESFHEGKTQLRGVPLTSTWSRDANAGKQELLRLVEEAGGNCISELTRIEHTRSKGNYNYTMFAWVGCAGVWARMRQVSDLEDAERLRIDEANEQFCETVHARMIETQRVLDQNRKSEARMYLFWKIGFPVLVVVVGLLFLKSIF
jgi:hypothetical protein